MPNNILLASDTFQRPSENPLSDGGQWTNFPTWSSMQISAGSLCEASAAGATCGCYWNAITWPADQISEVTLNAMTTSSDTLVLVVRGSTVNQSKYQLNISTNTNGANIYRISSSGVATQIKALPNYTFHAGDVWTFIATGTLLIAALNYKPVGWIADTTYASGVPGIGVFVPTTIANIQYSAWRGYNTLQQDGIWKKQGCTVTPIASDLGQATSNGTQNPTILFDSNPQILTQFSNVYKMWFTAGQNLGYAESTDGLNWTRNATNLLTGEGTCPCVFKVGSTYHLYAQPGNETTYTVQHYTSSDGMTWSGGGTVFTIGGVGAWDHGFIYYFSPVFIDTNGILGPAGTWYALYTGGITNTRPNILHTGLATSTDGDTWTRYASNPVVDNFWGITRLALINGIWYAWGQYNNPGQGVGTDSAIVPGEGLRMQTTNLTTWTNPVHSIHHTQYFEAINLTTGGYYPNFVMNVNGLATMYGVSTNDDTGVTPYYYQIGAAVGPTSLLNLVTKPEDNLQQVATDNFNRANENPLSGGGNWHAITGQGALQIVSHLCECATTAGSAMTYTGAGSAIGNDQYSSITVATMASGSFVYPLVRAATGASTFYYFFLPSLGSQSTTASFQKLVAGSGTQIGPNLTLTLLANDVITLQVVGTTLTAYQNGFIIGQVQDNSATPITTGTPGIGENAATSVANAQVSLWAGGNANVTPSYPSAASMTLTGVG